MSRRRWGWGVAAAVATVLLIVLVQRWRTTQRLQSEVDQAVADFADFGGSIGLDRGGRLAANLGITAITDKEVALLAPLAGLRMVDLRFSQVTDAGLAPLSNLTGVTDLNLDRTQINGSGLAHLKNLSSLVGLEISYTRVDDDALSHLRPLTNLRRLDITGTKVTAAGLAQLRVLKHLEYLAVSSELIKDAEAVLKGDLPRLQVQDDQFDMAGGPTWSANAGYPQLRTAERLKPPVRVIQTAPLSDGGTYTVWLQGSDGAVLTVCISCPDFFAKKRLPRHVYQGGVAAGDPGARVVPTSGPQRDGLVAALVDIVTRPLPVPDGVKDSEHEYAVAWGLLDQLSEDCKKAGDPVPERPPRQPPKKRPSQDPDPNVHPGPVITNSIGMKLALIPAGEFRMGSPTWEQYHFDSERWHSVRITRPFYIGAYEVTLGEFLQFYDDGNNKDEWTSQPKETSIWGGITLLDDKYRNYFEGQVSPLAWGHPDQTPQHPVVNVNWDDAVAFCDWLSRKEGKRYRLPTEAEWEYACRAGTKTPRYNGKDSERLVEVANVADASMREIYYLPQGLPGSDGYPFTAPVGQFEPNRFGLYDMYGNVCEWCSDWLDDAYYAKSPVDDPQGPGSGKFRVNRGGDWRNDPGIFCRSASRSGLNPMWRNCSHGFRIVREEASDDSPAPPSKE